MSEGNGVLVIGELSGSRLITTTKELLNAGGQLANSLGTSLYMALLGANLNDVLPDALSYGVNRIFVAEHTLLDEIHVESYVAALQEVYKEAQPSVVLVPRTQFGRELGPRFAFRLGVGLVQDAVRLEVEPDTKQLRFTRPVYGGNAMAVVTMTSRPQVVTIRPKVFEVAPRNDAVNSDVVRLSIEIPESVVRTKVVQRVASEETAGVKLEEARVVVAGGRGLGGTAPFADLDNLAKLLGGAVGASRPACDAGWIDPRFQIGLTGKTVTPELYIAVAISGACQHMAGCSGAKVIVAVNNNPDAEIFKEAQYGVVGDWKKIVPALTEAVRGLVS